MKATVRKEVHLEPHIIIALKALADKKKIKLKPFMERLLIREAAKANHME